MPKKASEEYETESADVFHPFLFCPFNKFQNGVVPTRSRSPSVHAFIFSSVITTRPKRTEDLTN